MPADIVSNVSELQSRVNFLEEKLMTGIDAVRDNQERMCEDISKIKEAVYNPDNGLYARLRVLEDQNRAYSKFIWLLFCLLYTSPSPRDKRQSRMPSSA